LNPDKKPFAFAHLSTNPLLLVTKRWNMLGENRANKQKSTKHRPKGLTIIHEDRDIIVVDKINGLLTMGTERERENTAYFILTDHVRKGNPQSRNRIFIVHRLDRDTSGVLVFSKSEQAKRFLQDNWKDFTKTYYTVVHGHLKEKEGVISSYLTENSAFRMYSVNNPDKGKFSKTGYKVLKENRDFSLLEINLFTGTKNQIRVHFAENGNPVAGDKIYGIGGKGIKRLALHSASLTLAHPFTKKEMTFETVVPPYFYQLVK
jgi:tRNA pseudouridine32 synthase/23S rRNA pseudouridine746 synthase/23S rRNA pseudouridine1911/1915/1917 synthase